MADSKNDQDASSKPSGPSEAERKEESSKAAQQSIDAQKKARELTQAATGAGDPEERQRLLNEALEQEIASESFGKTAKYMQSGPFQGMAAGAGIGVGTGAGLGTLSGALVGGTTSMITGGLGGAVGTGLGALHGPFIKMGDVAGGGIRKVTGDLPGWEATDEQKESLEKMVGQVHETERPGEEELEALTKGGEGGGSGGEDGQGGAQGDGKAQDAGEGGGEAKSSWTESATSYLPSMGSGEKTEDGKGKDGGQEADASWTGSAASYMPSKDSMPSVPSWGSKETDGQQGGAENADSTDKAESGKEPEAPEGGKQGGSLTQGDEEGDESTDRAASTRTQDEDQSKQTTFQGMGGADPRAVSALQKKLA